MILNRGGYFLSKETTMFSLYLKFKYKEKENMKNILLPIEIICQIPLYIEDERSYIYSPSPRIMTIPQFYAVGHRRIVFLIQNGILEKVAVNPEGCAQNNNESVISKKERQRFPLLVPSFLPLQKEPQCQYFEDCRIFQEKGYCTRISLMHHALYHKEHINEIYETLDILEERVRTEELLGEYGIFLPELYNGGNITKDSLFIDYGQHMYPEGLVN